MPDLFDDQIRAVLSNSIDKGPDARSILSELTPALHRVRRVARVKIAATGLAVAFAASGAAAAVHTIVNDKEPSSVVAAVPIRPTNTTLASPSITTSQASVPTTTTRPEGVPTSINQQSPTLASSPSTIATTTKPDRSTMPSSTTSFPDSSTTSFATTTHPEASTTTSLETKTIESSCGTIQVSISGDTITLVSVNANPGYSIDRKDDGPETVEVSFEGPGGHCEIKTEVRDGALWTDVSTE